MSDRLNFDRAITTQWPGAKYFAKGGNSYVYRALIGGSEYAIKVFRRQEQVRYDRFNQEIKHIQTLKGIKGIVPVTQINENPPAGPTPVSKIKSISDLAYYIMPLYPSNLLSQLNLTNADNGILAVQKTLEIAKIISELHERNLAHRDLKPENTLLTKDGSLLVSDFGLCIDLSNIPLPDDRLSEEGEIIGSISYRAPELLRGRLDSSDHRPCDVYSLGRILWALIWGKEPHNLTDLEFQELTINDCGHPIRKPQTLDDIIKGATNTNPKFRLDIHKFILFLENWLKDSPAESAAAIISKIENSDAVMQKLKAKTITDEIYVLHDGMTNHINATMEELLKEWRAIADPLKAKGVGNGVDIMAGSGGALSDTAPKLMGITLPDRANQYVFRMRMSLGVALPDLFDLAIYMYINFDDFSGQEYFIIPVHIPSDQIPPNISPELLGEVIYRKFDYRDADIKQQIIIDLQNAFEPMDKRFRDKLKRKQVN